MTDDAIKTVLKTAGVSRKTFNRIADEVFHAIHGNNGFLYLAAQYGIEPKNRIMIDETLKTIWNQHKHLFSETT